MSKFNIGDTVRVLESAATAEAPYMSTYYTKRFIKKTSRVKAAYGVPVGYHLVMTNELGEEEGEDFWEDDLELDQRAEELQNRYHSFSLEESPDLTVEQLPRGSSTVESLRDYSGFRGPVNGISQILSVSSDAVPVTGQEVDPHGKSAHTPGAKLDAGKIRADLVLGEFALALKEVCRVGTFGAQKYTDSGWVTVPNGESRYSDAMLRHYLDEQSGQENDVDSGLKHAAHLAWNALARLELMLRRK